MADRLLQMLEDNIKRNGRVLPSDVHRLTNIIERTGSCSPSQAHILLKSSGAILVDLDRRRRTELVERQFSLLKRLIGRQLDVSHYNLLLSVSELISNNRVISSTLSLAGLL